MMQSSLKNWWSQDIKTWWSYQTGIISTIHKYESLAIKYESLKLYDKIYMWANFEQECCRDNSMENNTGNHVFVIYVITH